MRSHKFIFLFFLSACSPKPQAPQAVQETTPEALFAQGKTVYLNSCVICHNINPSLPGGAGPEIANSPVELLKHKMVLGTYPQGYKRKRETAIMPKFPHLESQIPALAEYLRR